MKSIVTGGGIKVIQILSGRSNVFLISNGNSNILIDTSPANKCNKLLKRLSINKIDHINCLILTHSHFDHAGNASVIQKKFGCPVLLHRAEEYNLKSGEISIPKGTIPFSRFVMKYIAPKILYRLKCLPCKPDILVDSEFDLSVFGFNAGIIHTPGHTPGSVSIIVDDEVAIVGDTMFGVLCWSVFPPYADNVSQLIKSWEKLLNTKCRIFLPSHGGQKYRNQVMKDYLMRKDKNPS